MKKLFDVEKSMVFEVERKIAYWQHMLSKLERNMLKMQSERVDMKHRLVHLQLLQKQVETQTELTGQLTAQ
ncbi:hypothetical protein C4573_00595 [Candidatus Woesearchaeota archaeon]|nr:MAG: hypothetical protein C4573_00595 [Candidatus Woesearchaeota archaeon]